MKTSYESDESTDLRKLAAAMVGVLAFGAAAIGIYDVTENNSAPHSTSVEQCVPNDIAASICEGLLGLNGDH